MESLVIVESPAKAKTIRKILGGEYEVKASVGHIRDLPKNDLGVEVKDDFRPTYVIIPGKEKVVKELKKAAKGAGSVYLATDPDREGEAIAFHIAEEIRPARGGPQVYRITFHEITERAVREALSSPEKIDHHKVDAQQARRVLDRLVGYSLSPFLWRKVRRGLSAGRVQSVAVRLIVDREREIEAFQKEEYWTVESVFQPLGLTDTTGQFKASLYKYNDELVVNREAKNGRRFLITDGETARSVIEALRDKTFSLLKIDKKLRKRGPAPPFITSTLQQEAARKFRLPAKKTMSLAQQLYEGIELGAEGSVGLITYMRTDSFKVADEAQRWAREYITGRFGKGFVPDRPPHYKSRGSAQEAHEAIRPTYPDRSPEKVKQFLSKDLFNLYNLIWNRFIASQMSPALLEQTVFVIGPADGADQIQGTELRSAGTVIQFPGFMSLYIEGKDEIEEEEGALLPSLSEGAGLDLKELSPSQHFTQPPPRYSEATLIKALEEKGIGRPSTYAAILSTIQDRKYILKNEGRFAPTELGMVVNDLLVERFPDLIDIGFTAKMEDDLDAVENAGMEWVKVIRGFFEPFRRDLEAALKDLGKIKPEDIPTDTVCEQCGKPMVIRWGRHGRFLACSGYPKCRNSRPLNGENGATDGEPIPTEETCERCGAPMVIRNGRFGKFLACSQYPACKYTKAVSTGVKCPLDGGDIVEKKTKRGKPFWSCSNYPACTYALWYKPVGKRCPKCNAVVLVEKKNRLGELLHACVEKGCGHKEKVTSEAEGSETPSGAA